MKVTAIVVTLFMLFVLPAFTQAPPTPPPTAPPVTAQEEPNTVHLTAEDKLMIGQLLSNLKDTTIDAYQSKIHLDDDNQKIGQQSAEINKVLDGLRTKYNLPKDAYFKQDKLYFVKSPPVAPAPPEKK